MCINEHKVIIDQSKYAEETHYAHTFVLTEKHIVSCYDFQVETEIQCFSISIKICSVCHVTAFMDFLMKGMCQLKNWCFSQWRVYFAKSDITVCFTFKGKIHTVVSICGCMQ